MAAIYNFVGEAARYQTEAASLYTTIRRRDGPSPPSPAYAALSCATFLARSAAAGCHACSQSAACWALAAAVKIARLSPHSTFSQDAT